MKAAIPCVTISSKTIVLAAVAALTGGLAGSIFTAVVTHQHPTVVTYKAVLPNVVDSRTTALVHDLKIGNDNVKSIYTRVFDFAVRSGPTVASASLVIYFQPDLKIFGMEAIPPSKVRPDWMNPPAISLRCVRRRVRPPKSFSRQSQSLPAINSDQSAARCQGSKPHRVCRNPPLRQISGQENLIFCVVSLGIFFGSSPLSVASGHGWRCGD